MGEGKNIKEQTRNHSIPAPTPLTSPLLLFQSCFVFSVQFLELRKNVYA